MKYKLNFAKTINDTNIKLPKGRGDCFDYGSVFGCDKDCPAYINGDCPEPDEINKE